MTDAATLVTRACDALAAGRPEEALEPLLAAWRAVRAPALADLLDALDRSVYPEGTDSSTTYGHAAAPVAPAEDDLDPGLVDMFDQLRAAGPAIAGSTEADPSAGHDAWLARARQHRPADLRRLMDTLVREEEVARQRWTPLDSRLAALTDWPDDPRMTAGLARLLEWVPSDSARTRGLSQRVASLVSRIGDRRVITRMARVDPARAQRIASEMPPAPELDAALRAACERLGERLGVRLGPLEQDLLARLHADPEDDAARLAYADWLAERDDPWAEVIRFDLRPGSGDAARRDALVQAHGWRILGPLADVVDVTRFARGFPAVGRLRPGVTRTRPQATAGRPEWATFDELELDGYAASWQPTMRPRRLSRVTPDDLLALLATPRGDERLERLAVTFVPADRDEAAARAFASLTWTRGLPRLRELSFGEPMRGARCDPEHLRPLWSSPAGAALTALGCRVTAPPIARWLDELALAPPTLARVELAHLDPSSGPLSGPSGWVFTLTRDPGGRFSQVHAHDVGRPDLADLSSALRHAARRITRLSLARTGPRHVAEAVRELETSLPLNELPRGLGQALQADLGAWVRPRVERLPTVTVRRLADHAQWTFQQESFALGELVLAWYGCVLGWSWRHHRRVPLRSGDPITAGDDRYEVEIEDVERMVASDHGRSPLAFAGCRFCGRIRESADMHDRATCHHCAERWLGIIY